MKNTISWKQYQQIKEKYPHVASFAYWPDGHSGNQAEPLIADTEDEFNEKLLGNIQANVVVVGMNFGINKEIAALMEQDLTNEELITKWKEFSYMQNQYGGKYGKKAMNKAFKDTMLEGAYMTDLMKFKRTDTDWIPTGLPSKRQNGIDDLMIEDPDLVEHNIKGLHHELYDIVGITEDPIFIFLGSKYYDDEEIQNLMKQHFPNSTSYKMSHYARYGYKTIQFNEEAANILKEIEKAKGE